jgi:hypothetical protein
VRVWNRAQVMRSNAAPLFERVAKVFGGLAMSHSDEPRTTGPQRERHAFLSALDTSARTARCLKQRFRAESLNCNTRKG